MNRLKLAIADVDENYMSNLAAFLMNRYSGVFELNCFTSPSLLENYLAGDETADVLLINPVIYSESMAKFKTNTIIFLTDEKVVFAGGEKRSIYKYQRGDKIASSIMEFFSHNNVNAGGSTYGGKNPRIVFLYSPAGGTGKTSVCYFSGMICARNGMSVLYLNLESIQTTPLLFNCEPEWSMSKVIYHLKEKSKRMDLILDTARCMDSGSNMAFFSPPESALELEEIHPEELRLLFDYIRMAGRYDIVFVDTSSIFDRRSMVLMESCDEMFLVLTGEETCRLKLKAFMAEIGKHMEGQAAHIWSKTTVVLNKFKGNACSFLDELISCGVQDVVRLPEIDGLYSMRETNFIYGTNSGFYNSIRRLVEKHLKTDGETVYGAGR